MKLSLNLNNNKSGQKLSFKQNKVDLDDLAKALNALMKANEIPVLKGQTAQAKMDSAVDYFLCENKNCGDNFKSVMNPVLKFLAQKGVRIDVQPYRSKLGGDVFTAETIIDKNAKSHLSQTLKDARSRFFLNDLNSVDTYITPNSARLAKLEAIDAHRSFYEPTLFEYDHMARMHAFSIAEFRPKFPTEIKDNISKLLFLKNMFRRTVERVNGVNNEMYKKSMEILMPEKGILKAENLSKVKMLKDDYEPQYPKAFDWKSWNEMMHRSFDL